MQVFVLRHGQAEPQLTTDDARNLTEQGRIDVAASVRNSLNDLMKIQEIWSSPLVRAQQTAEIVRSILAQSGVHLGIKTTDLITPESDPLRFFDELQIANSSSILLASHQPFVGDFIDLFCGSPLGAHPMNTSSIAFIECDVAAAACGDLRWLRHVAA